MPNSFLNKVSAERRVLSVINTHFRGKEQLAGLSKSAINLWQRRVGASATHEVIEALTVLADVCQSLSDRSNESFTRLNPEVEKRLETELVALGAAVHQLQTREGDRRIKKDKGVGSLCL